MSESEGSDRNQQDASFVLRNETTKRYLRIADDHVETIRRITSEGSYPIPRPVTDAAAVVTVFAAVAAEGAVNHYIARPLLAIRDDQIQSFFGRLVTEYMHLPRRTGEGIEPPAKPTQPLTEFQNPCQELRRFAREHLLVRASSDLWKPEVNR